MSVLENWIQTPVAAALGWTLVHSLWEGGLAALVLVAALRVLRSSRARYAAGCLAMLGLLAAFGFTFTRLMLQQPAPEVRLAKPVPPAPEGGDTWWVGPGRARRDPAPYLRWLAPFWVAGVLVFQLRAVASWMAARRLRRTGVCRAPDLWQVCVDRLSARLRLSRPVTLLESALAGVPVVTGYFRPVIL